MTHDERISLWNEAVKLGLVGKINKAGDVQELCAVSLICQELSHATGWPVTREIWTEAFIRYHDAHRLPIGTKPIKYRPGYQRASEPVQAGRPHAKKGRSHHAP